MGQLSSHFGLLYVSTFNREIGPSHTLRPTMEARLRSTFATTSDGGNMASDSITTSTEGTMLEKPAAKRHRPPSIAPSSLDHKYRLGAVMGAKVRH
jgi:hypothetical protein